MPAWMVHPLGIRSATNAPMRSSISFGSMGGTSNSG
ncbi:unannotated protein [freshwater metagenome]|uniref:Unannotated protein n=1 Tax=freshwater metagenome TaxID=449393 RepID=A0A6J7CSP5_9ZZZZ